MKTYHKINSLFLRDMESEGKTKPLLIGQWAQEEFRYLADNKWTWTEKIDGTNIRAHYDGTNVTFGGRTDRAQIPKHLADHLSATITPKMMEESFPSVEYAQTDVTLYGEGYGIKIQHGHNYIRNGVGFILFDIKVGGWWLRRDTCEDIAKATGLKIVPIVGEGTIQDAIDFVRDGFVSLISENREYMAEGVVIKPSVDLLARSGQRIISKVKTVDFQ